MLAVRLVRAMYVLSGVATFAYQFVWLRHIGFALGLTEAAQAATMATALGSLALGSALASRFVDRTSPDTALRVFALAQALAGVLAVALPSLLSSLVPWARGAYADGLGALWFGAVRTVVGIAVILPPAALLGACFPLATRWLEGREKYPASGASWLYALHTVGGAVGAALVTVLLVPRMGLSAIALAAAGVNWLVAIAALSLGYVLASGTLADQSPDRPTSRTLLGSTPATARPWLARIAVVGAAFVLFANQSVWTRILMLLVGSSAGVLATLSLTFALGVGLGATIATRLLRVLSLGQVTVALGITIAVGGLTSLIAAWLVPQLPILLASGRMADPASAAAFSGNPQALVSAVILPMSTTLGAALPFAIAISLPNRSDTATGAAGLWSLHLVGAVVGLLTSAFVLMELVGLRWSVMGVALFAFVIGVWVVLLAGETTVVARIFWAAVVAGATLSAFVLPEWEPRLLASGAYDVTHVRGPDVRTGLEAAELLFYEEGVRGTVSVRRSAGTTSIALNGHLLASNGDDVVPQKLLAHIALLLHTMPREVGVLGLHTGITLGAALRHPLAHADVVEPSPEIVQAASYFASENHGALSDPRVAILVTDTLAHVRLSSRTYDVLLSAPPPLWREEGAVSVSSEFYAASRARLSAGGVFAQWLPTPRVSPRALRAAMAAFAATFPEASAWVVPDRGVILAGSLEPMAQAMLNLRDQWDRPGLGNDLADLGATVPAVVLNLWSGDSAGLRGTADSPAVAMDRVVALAFDARADETSAADVHALLASASTSQAPDAVVRARNDMSPARQFHSATLLLRSGAPSRAVAELSRAAAADPTNADILAMWARASAEVGRTGEVAAFLATLIARDPTNVSAAIELSRLQAADGRLEQAAATAREAAARAPTDLRPLVQLGMLAVAQANDSLLDEVLPRLTGTTPLSADIEFLQAYRASRAGDLPEALGLLGRVVSAQPNNARAWALLGTVQARAGNRDRARDAFQSAIHADARLPEHYIALGQVELDNANAEGAVVWFSQALTIAPSSAPATTGLAQALRRLGQTRRAADIEAQLTTPR